MRIPLVLATQSEGSRPPNPDDCGHLFRLNMATCSEVRSNACRQAISKQAIIEQLSAVFRTPTLVAKTYFAAREIESAEKERLIRQKLRLEEDLAQARQQAIELMKPVCNRPNKDEVLAIVNRKAVDLSRQLGCRNPLYNQQYPAPIFRMI